MNSLNRCLEVGMNIIPTSKHLFKLYLSADLMMQLYECHISEGDFVSEGPNILLP